MVRVTAFDDFKELVQSVFDRNEETLERYGQTHIPQVKTYLIESNVDVGSAASVLGPWEPLDLGGWYVSREPDYRDALFLDARDDRVWRLVSLLDATLSDALVESWVRGVRGLDRCWLPRGHLLEWDSEPGWHQRGVGLRFRDELAPEEEQANFSLKAWHGASRLLPDLDDLLHRASRNFAIYSVRWQKGQGHDTELSAEVYSDGKVTINRAIDTDEALAFTSRLALRYGSSLSEAETLRDQTLSPFELEFTQKIDFDAFAEAVSGARSPMRLWLTETEREEDFRRYRGVDLHTWDRVLLDLGPTYAYLTVPGKGCVNAAPRIATLQGENTAGRTRVFHDGVELFA